MGTTVQTDGHIISTGPHWGKMHRDAGPQYRKWKEIQKSQKVLRTTEWTDGRKDGHIILPLRWFEPCPAAACAARNDKPRKWTSIANFKQFFKQKFWYNLYLKIRLVYFIAVYLKTIKQIVTSVHLNSTGLANDRQKETRTTGQRYRQTYKLVWTPLRDNLAEPLNGALAMKIGQGILSYYLMYRDCNFSIPESMSMKVNPGKVFRLYELKCSLCDAVYIGNT